MTLPPDLALAHLATLSVDVRAAAVTTAGGELLAGDPDAIATATHSVADDEHAIHVRTGPQVLGTLLELDLRSMLGDMRNR